MGRLVLIAFLVFFRWIYKRDNARRTGISGAVWIPTIWAGILASRPLSAWLGAGGGDNSLEGSPLDRLFYFGFIIASFIVLAQRRLNWGDVISRNWPLFLFYGYCLVSVAWADAPVVSFKRWFKDFGNIPVALVLLTEQNPGHAIRAVFVRCGYLLIPLSYIFIRWFPDLGRRYNMHSGALEAVGVTFQKNSLGAMIVVCVLIIVWDWFQRTTAEHSTINRVERYFLLLVFGLGCYMLHLADSKTSIVILALGAGVIASVRLPFIQKRVGALGGFALLGTAAFFVIDEIVGIKETIVTALGRDMTFTGRTDVWRELFALKTDPLIGTGFLSFWSDMDYQSKLPDWVAFSAHNGYIETYIDGGYIGVFFLVVMLGGVAFNINRELKTGSSYALMRFAVLGATLVGNFSESHFTRMSPLWFLFLLAALQPMHSTAPQHADATAPESSDDYNYRDDTRGSHFPA